VSSHTALGDRMKHYEAAESDRRLLPGVPTLARMDGRAFHRFTRGMLRPYDDRFVDCMVTTARQLAKATNACIGYTASDEITLVWHEPDPHSQIWFDGRVAKMTSGLAALATLYFNQAVADHFYKDEGYAARNPVFDARVWVVPNRREACNALLWREQDATRNSLSAACQCHYSHRELLGKGSAEQHELLHAAGINWHDYPYWFKRGTYVRKVTCERGFTLRELDKLPERHEARRNPDLKIWRSDWQTVELPPISTIVNAEAVVFENADPVVASTEPEDKCRHQNG